MSVDHIIEGFVAQGWERWSQEVDSIYLVRLKTLIHRESTCSRW